MRNLSWNLFSFLVPALLSLSALNALGCVAEQTEDDTEDTLGVAESASHSSCGQGHILRTTTGFSTPESAYWDADSQSYYVSNIVGTPGVRDGEGFLSKLDKDGNIVDLHWIDGLDSPLGIRVRQGKLYTTNLDELIVVDIATKAVTRIPAPGAVLLNDPVITGNGTVYVTDVFTNRIYKFANGVGSIFFESALLDLPNGLLLRGNRLIIASTGNIFGPIVPGHLWELDIPSKSLEQIGDFEAKMDGIERDRGTYLISETGTSLVYRVDDDGDSEIVHDFSQDGLTAINDIGYDPQRRIISVPAYLDNSVTFYQIP